MTKVCYTCRLEKPFEDFYADKTRKDGRGGLCKLCIDTYLQKYRKTDKYKEMHGRNQRKYEKSHPLVVRAHNRTFERKLNKYYCENCHSIINLQFHHPDYSEPDNVIVLCIKCHTSLHTKKEMRICDQNPTTTNGRIKASCRQPVYDCQRGYWN